MRFEAARTTNQYLEDRYLPEPNSGCYLWIGAVGYSGYGRFLFHGTVAPAHRVMYEATVGPIPDGLHIDHLCRNRACVNPTHLEPVTCKENILRGVSLQAQNAKKTHCRNGHAYDNENTRRDRDGRRYCRICNRALSKVRKQRARQRVLQRQEGPAAHTASPADATISVGRGEWPCPAAAPAHSCHALPAVLPTAGGAGTPRAAL